MSLDLKGSQTRIGDGKESNLRLETAFAVGNLYAIK